ncbi:DNA-binding transcriptional regulator, AcrR family [Paracoccus isoporae]|uniref:DNA-binding transcriptional regulator, AcrR family n=1 Tax=Paracoccus isoporae TaxID=591205 RepID=A0A1G6TAE5_9RHOB|nr:TetR/AcrR family transcriptional regulator [Paracoccus isoporae]SDD26031.1 DNA-binding transcriptional regulator, AcrR family [Paracoccus isoporae]
MGNEERLVTRGRKFGQVLEGARRVFMRDGYEGASVDDIAREAAVSKATLYSYFPDKKLMFDAVFREELERERVDGKELVGLDLPVDQVLRFTGHLIANHAVSEFGSRTLRLAIAEAERFPGLAAEYYQLGPAALQKTLERQLRHWQKEGMLRDDIPDLNLAADSFIQLNTVRLKDRVMLTGRDSVDDVMIRRTVDNAVTMFLRAFGTGMAQRLIET